MERTVSQVHELLTAWIFPPCGEDDIWERVLIIKKVGKNALLSAKHTRKRKIVI